MNTVRFARTKTVFTVEQRRRSALDMLCLSYSLFKPNNQRFIAIIAILCHIMSY